MECSSCIISLLTCKGSSWLHQYLQAAAAMNSNLICFGFVLLFSRGCIAGTPPQHLPEAVIRWYRANDTDNDIMGFNSNNADLTIGSDYLSLLTPFTGIPIWTMTMEFGVDRHCDAYMNPSSYLSIPGLEHANTDLSSIVFLQVLWFANEDRLYETVFHEVRSAPTTVSSLSSASLLPNITFSVTSGSTTCKVVSGGTKAEDPGGDIFNLQFAVFEESFFVPTSIEQSINVGTNAYTGRFQVDSAPSRLAIGYLSLAKTPSAPTILDSEITDSVTAVAEHICRAIDDNFSGCCESADGTESPTGETCSSCNNNNFGKCCRASCNSGSITAIPPYQSEICQCDLNFGGDECNEAGISEHYVSLMKYSAEQCQSEVSDHLDYLYKAAGDEDLMVIAEPFPGLQNVNNVSFGYDGELTSISYGQSFGPPLSAISDDTNDFLFAVSIEQPEPNASFFRIKVVSEHTNDANFDGRDTFNSSLTIENCSVIYHMAQWSGSTASAAIAQMFFVVGVQNNATFPSNITFESEKVTDVFDVVTDVWTMNGMDMSGLLMVYNVVAKDGPGSIPESELIELLGCYAERACATMPHSGVECRHGTPHADGERCICDSGWIGATCNLPLC